MSMAVHGRGTDPIVRFSAVGHESDVADIIAATGDGTPRALTAVFASADYDLAELAAQLRRRGVRRIIGAVTGRVIGSDGFTASGAVGFHLPVDRFAAADTVFDDAAGITLPELRRRAQELRMQLESGPGAGMPHRFALLLVDAESRSEERLAAVLGMELNGVPLIGGSAGDLYFNPLGHASGRACLLRNGEVGRGAAVLCMVASASGVAAYCHNHYLRSDKKLVITDADPARRLVREIDGRPALEVYSAACGFRRPPSDSRDFAPFPRQLLRAWNATNLCGWRVGVRVCARARPRRVARKAGRHGYQPFVALCRDARAYRHAGTCDRGGLRCTHRLYGARVSNRPDSGAARHKPRRWVFVAWRTVQYDACK